MKVLILGSDGLVGKSVCNIFLQHGHDVIKWDIKMGSQYDLRIPNVLDDLIENIDFVVFLAFDVGGAKYNVYNKQYIDNNLLLMHNTFTSIHRFNKPFIHTTSTMSNMNNTPYASLKRIAEYYTRYTDGINVKLWNVYGYEPISEKSHVIPDIIHQAIYNNNIKLKSDGSETRMFLYCDDLAAAIYKIYINYNSIKNIRSIVDISSDKWLSILNIATIIKDKVEHKLGRNISIDLSDNVIGDSHSIINQPDLATISSIWKPNISIEEGIEIIVNKFLSDFNS
jgi:nucleoside-diphosphate-sugar epimerase